MLTAVVIVVVAWWANRSVENAVKTNLAGQLPALLDSHVAALEFWFEERRVDARSMARMNRVRQSILQLNDIAAQSNAENLIPALLASDALSDLRERMQPLINSDRIEGFVVLNKDGLILARDQDPAIGNPSIAAVLRSDLAPVFKGKTVIIPPFPNVFPKATSEDGNEMLHTGAPVMSVVSPIRSDEEEIIAALWLELNPEAFTRILQVARAGQSGETYAFNSDGVMVTRSRFDDDLKRAGLLLDDAQSQSILSIQVRDPGVDLTQGDRAKLRRPDQPLTRMAAAALDRKDGVDVDGYRDYRGVKVVGAWMWLGRERIGVTTEIDVAEAFRPLGRLRLAFAVLVSLLLATAMGMCGLTLYASRMERKARRAALEAKRLGQYALDEQIGAGGMGAVYRAHHDMLHRPTAVKLLHVDKTNETAIARFEQEVQLTSQLTHPNTIAIYDYGRTSEGVFYYAMEYLDGISLQELVSRFGPLPESRVIFLLRQLCGSLSEAHGLGLIHRDIKPANVMITKCGGMCDFVKLLDFGLVKPQDAERSITLDGHLAGTPHYLSPEAIQHHDLSARSDLYAVGAVGYFLLTGKPVFDGKSIVDICNQHVKSEPQRPSQQLDRPIDETLEKLILRCLAKHSDDRPESAEICERELARCRSAAQWTQLQAKAWWAEHLDVTEVSTTTTQNRQDEIETLNTTMIRD